MLTESVSRPYNTTDHCPFSTYNSNLEGTGARLSVFVSRREHSRKVLGNHLLKIPVVENRTEEIYTRLSEEHAGGDSVIPNVEMA